MSEKRAINYIGVITGIIAFFSLALPWWTMPMSVTFMGMDMSADMSVYTFDAKMTMDFMGVTESESIVDDFSIWYGYVALVLIIFAGVAAIAGSLTVGKAGRNLLIIAGVVALLSVTIFAAGLHNELVSPQELTGEPELTNVRTSGSFGLFSKGTFSGSIPGEGSIAFGYSTYLTFGFWLALAAGVIALVAIANHPMTIPSAQAQEQRVQQEEKSEAERAQVVTEPKAERKFFCRYCGKENKPDALYCEARGKKLA